MIGAGWHRRPAGDLGPWARGLSSDTLHHRILLAPLSASIYRGAERASQPNNRLSGFSNEDNTKRGLHGGDFDEQDEGMWEPLVRPLTSEAMG
jgi:hypothetical protein